ncbi:50S ribosomal protein L23 [Campylobacter sp. JMF_01 NE2]|uniref:50S ribosomal protein L23 n=1 Tax=unclassified Campylobacter TaxID=2593542 RepID=UPI0022EA009E|nr:MULTISPECIES: 50S ribosomal protein L23 [unclassified Campylobacter]MDA3043871.1 50S ribosomal protein L23 [Campylobacter sp. JMF_09 ED2]MDA3044020.1 50S ribosomal protein L23 [Campylobacter sp. JMF_07 ED4]MDA3045724.1 50S ribosomal protein L23 [Campylobacter sp. VBCF_06 NA8]MDA3047935.1 50S ribosomal protein L23 [Campylobacter sp. JMF_08 NE1]MDA3049881.1 50S ribosomal protein L23 [Campylobacter sp. JMF_15 NE4]
MADITDIKTILYTEKSLGLQESGVVVIQTSPSMTKNGLKSVLKEYFGIVPVKVNSLRQDGKVKRFRGRLGVRDDVKKFYVKLPEGATLENAEA